MSSAYSFPAEAGHTIELRQTGTGYDVSVQDAAGAVISTVALTALQALILISQLQSAKEPPKRTTSRRKVNR